MTFQQNQIPPLRKGVYLKPGQKITREILEKLAQANAVYTRTRDFSAYETAIRRIFNLDAISKLDTSTLFYLGGFVEGEGSLNVGAKKNDSSLFKLYLDPEFSVTQHVNGISNLYLALCYFKTGRIRHKTDSNATFVFTIDNRDSLEQKVVPFFNSYIIPYASPVKERRLKMFIKFLILFRERAHLDLNRMVNEVLPLWDAMRMQVGQSNQSFANLEDAQNYVRSAASRYS